MAEPAFDLQQKIRGNTQDFQDYLTQLYRWEDEIKKSDEDLTKAARNFTPDHKFPIRSKQMIQDALEKTPVITEVKENGTTSQHDKQKAIMEKNKGNDYFKAGKFEEAAKCYSTAIELDPTDAILPANRAIAYIKLSRFQEAEEDCSKSLTLDPTFVKAYHRRGTARTNLGSLEMARKDFEKVLTLEPHNKAAQVELERVLKEIEQSTSKVLLESPREEKSILNIMEKKSQAPTKLVSFSPTEAINVELPNASSFVIEEYFEPAISNEKPKEESHQILIVSVNNTKQEEAAIDKIVRGFGTKTGEPIEAKVSVPKPSAEIKPYQIGPVPKTYFQFHKEWKRLQKFSDLQFQYLKQIPPSTLPDMFRDSLETDVLGGIISTLKGFIQQNEPLLPWLLSLSRIKRIGAVAMFLSTSQKSDLKGLLLHMEDKGEGSDEDHQQIRQKLL